MFLPRPISSERTHFIHPFTARNCIPKHHEVWSFRVDRAYRIIFKLLGPNHVELRYIGLHHSIYNYDMFR